MPDSMRIHNARWVDPAGAFQEGTILIEQGRLRLFPARVVAPDGGRKLKSPPDLPSLRDGQGQVLDARERLIIPGLVDPHVHLRQPGGARVEGVRNGTRAALAGGVTSLLEMPNTRPPCSTPARLAAKQALFARQSLVNWGLHFLGGDGFREAPTGAAAAKIFLARSGLCPAVLEIEHLAGLFGRFPIVAIHGEDEGCFAKGVSSLPHDESRPRAAVLAALGKVEQALRRVKAGGDRTPCLVLLHVSTRDELAWVRRMKGEGFDIRAETCFHYLFFTKQDVRRQGARLRVNPPLREEADRQALREALRDGTIDFLATDHAPHSPAAKADQQKAPSGIPGLEWEASLLAMLVGDGLLTWKQALDLSCRNAAKTYGFPERGRIADGAPADLVLLEPERPGMPPLPIVTRAGYNPYELLTFPWRVATVFVNGHSAYQSGTWSAQSAGKDLYEPASST